VILAMSDIKVASNGHDTQLKRGEIAVFKAGDSYELPGDGSYYEIAIKPNHPPVKPPPELIRPDKNASIYEGPEFFLSGAIGCRRHAGTAQPQPASRDQA
jgi:hypothetical protein